MGKNKPDVVFAVARQLIKDIEEGKYGTEGIIPPRKTLSETLGVSADTANKAVMHLQAMGLVVPYGRNVIVNSKRLRIPGLTPSFDGFLKENGMVPYFKDIEEPKIVALDKKLADQFHLPAGTKVVKRNRLQGEKRVSDIPALGESRNKKAKELIIWYRLAETYYLYDLLKGMNEAAWLPEMIRDPQFNTTAAIEAASGEKIKPYYSHLVPRFPTVEEVESLEITFQTFVVEHWRRCFNADESQLIMFSKIVHIGSKCEFEFKGFMS